MLMLKTQGHGSIYLHINLKYDLLIHTTHRAELQRLDTAGSYKPLVLPDVIYISSSQLSLLYT